MANYIYQNNNWPNFTWNEKDVQVILGKIRHLQGKIFGQVSALCFSIIEWFNDNVELDLVINRLLPIFGLSLYIPLIMETDV